MDSSLNTWPPEIAKELGSFVMDFAWLDELVSETLKDLLEGPSDHLGAEYAHILHPMPLTTRIKLIRETYKHRFGHEQFKKYSETFKQLDQIIQRRNRMAHDWWADPYPLADDPEDDWVHLFRAGVKGKSGLNDGVSPPDLRALRKATENMFGSLEKFRQSFATTNQ